MGDFLIARLIGSVGRASWKWISVTGTSPANWRREPDGAKLLCGSAMRTYFTRHDALLQRGLSEMWLGLPRFLSPTSRLSR